LSKAAIEEVIRKRPTTTQELASIKGVGVKRMEMLHDKVLPLFKDLDD
jgi:hypothetical protein